MQPTMVDESTTTDTIPMPPGLTREWVERNPRLLHLTHAGMALDFAATTHIDSCGVSFVRILSRSARGKLVVKNIRPEILSALREWNSAAPAPSARSAERAGVFSSAGAAALDFWGNLVQALSMLVEILYWGTLGLAVKRHFRKGILGEQMYLLGYKALGIVGLLSLLIGVVMALQAAIQLRMFGAGIFLAPMIGISMVRELGPLMTAIILAGRTGSATAAEIGTMAVGEELDALQTMGINPIQYVAVPKLWAITVTMPILSIIATATGIIGGYLVSTLYLGIASSLYWNELFKSIALRDFAAGFTKSVVFSWLIIWMGAFYGFRVKGGAEQVGRETTACVVTAIFVIVLADAVFSFIF